MSRQVPKSDQFPYHVSARTPNREFFKLPIEVVWKVFEDYLFLTKEIYNLNIHAFVLMSNHFHLLVSTPDANISEAMNYLLREISKELNRNSGRINQNWGGPHYKTLIESFHYFMNTYKYIHRNPVRAGLCAKVEDYPFSTLHGLCGQSRLVIPVEEDTLLFDPNFNLQTLEWLNTPSCPNDEEEVRKALRRRFFEFSKDQGTGYGSHLVNDLI